MSALVPTSSEAAASPGQRAGARRSSGVQSVDRAFEILEVLAARESAVPLSEIAAATQLPAATAHRLLRTMIAHGYVAQLHDRSYALGPRLAALGDAASRGTGPLSP